MTSVAKFVDSDLAILMRIGSSSLFIIQRPTMVEKIKKTNVNNKTYRNGSGPFSVNRFALLNSGFRNPGKKSPLTSYMYAYKRGTKAKMKFFVSNSLAAICCPR